MTHPQTMKGIHKILLAVLALPGVAYGLTTIAANTPGSNGMGATNSNVTATFGDNIALAAPGNAVFVTAAGVDGVVGTPAIDLSWANTGGTAWQYHAWTGAGGGALQMDGSAAGSTFSVTFTPSANARLKLNSFNFIGDTNGDIYQYRVDLVDLTTNTVVFTTTPATWTTSTATSPYNAAPQVTINYTATTNVAYRLDIVRIGGTGNAYNIAIDNLSFDQLAYSAPTGPQPYVPFIPRPSQLTSEWRFSSRDTAGIINKAFGPGELKEIGMTGHQGVFSTVTGAGSAEVPGAISGGAMPVMYFDGAAKSGEGWRLIPNTGVADHYEYSLVYDLFVPESNTAAKLAMFQGNAGNTNDADYFLLPSAPTGIFRTPVTPNTNLWSRGQWQRIVIVADYTRDSDKVYVNGVLKSTQPKGDWLYGTNYGWILSDNGSASYVGDHGKGYISAFAVVPRLMTDTEIGQLGTVTPGGIFEVSDGYPAGLAGSPDTTTGTITLTWHGADTRCPAAGVEVLRNGVVLAQLALESSTYTDTPPAATTTQQEFTYMVRPYGGSYTGGHSHPECSVQWSLPSMVTGLVAYYPFENDYSNQAGATAVGDAVPSGAPVFIASGRRGKALEFTDTAVPAQQVAFNPAPLNVFASSTNFTVSIWYRHMGSFANRSSFGGSTSDPVLIGNKNWANGANQGWTLACNSDGSVKWNYKGSGGSRVDVTISPKENADDAWHHLLVVHDRAGSARFFVDGKKLATETSIASQGSVETGYPVTIGADALGASRYRGDIDEVAFWTRALTDEEAGIVHQNGQRNISVTGSNFADSDQDGLPDGWETSFFGNLSQDGTNDHDKDGASNLVEFSQGSNPAISEINTRTRFDVLPDPANPLVKVAAFCYQRPATQTDIQYIPEISYTLNADSWFSGDAVLPRYGLPEDVGNGNREITVYRPGDYVTETKAFFRLRLRRAYQGERTIDFTPQLDYTAAGPVVRWTSSEPTPTIVEYGNGGNLTVRYEDYTLSTEHEVLLTSIPEGGDLSFSVVSLIDGMELRSESFTASGSYDLRPPRVPNQAGYVTGGSHAFDAASILATMGNGGKGWCLDIGCGDGKLAFEIVRQSELMVIGVESDPVKVAAATAFLAERGVLGSRVTILPVANYNLASLPFRPHTFNLITNAGSFSGPGLGGLAAYQTLLKPTHGRSVSGPAASLAVATKPRPAGFGNWSHQYGTPENTTYSGEQLVGTVAPAGAAQTTQTEIQWIGRPGGAFSIDRGIRQASPLAVNGRFFALGEQRVIAMDSHNGSVLWSKLIPNLARFNVLRDCSNLAADDDALFAATGAECWRINGDSGAHTVMKVTAPARQDITWHWGFVCRQGTRLIGSAVSSEASYKKWWGPQFWYDSKSGSDTNIVCGDNMFSRDAATGAQHWLYQGGLILHPTITVTADRILFLESRAATAMAGTARALPMASLNTAGSLWMVALDPATGTKLWETQPTITGGTPGIFGSFSNNVYLITASNSTDSKYHLHAFNATTGAVLWSANHAWNRGDHAGHQQHPVILNGLVYQEPKVYNLTTGAVTATTMPGRNACSTYIGVKNALIYRGAQTTHYGRTDSQYGGNISMWDPATNTKTLWNRMRPSCWISTIGGDGMLLAQDGAAGCSCGPWLEVTLGLSPL